MQHALSVLSAVSLFCLAVGCGAEPRASTEIESPQPAPSASSSSASLALEEPEASLEVAVTVDDLPVHGPAFPGIDRLAIAKKMLDAFRRHRLPPVYGFVNGKHVDTHPETQAILELWKTSGNPLGNHTYSHIGLNDASIDAYLADLERGEAILKKLVSDPKEWKVFRYPYLFEGPDLEKRNAVRGYLFEHGYMLAPVTIDGDDWAWNPPYARCSEKRDEAALVELVRGYVATHVKELRFIRKATRTIVGRDIKHVLLLHIGAADAAAIDALLTAFEAEGVKFIDLPTALADPVYAIDHGYPSKAGAAFPYPLAKSKGIRIGPLPERPEEDALESTCR